MLGTQSMADRLRHLLAYLVELYGVPERTGTVIASTFSHADLAHLIGSTRQWVTISLLRLQKAGVLSYRRRFITIRRPEALGVAARRVAAPTHAGTRRQGASADRPKPGAMPKRAS